MGDAMYYGNPDDFIGMEIKIERLDPVPIC